MEEHLLALMAQFQWVAVVGRGDLCGLMLV
jgi:hypothetical protein